ncbi:MAG: ZIP family metal transporter [Acidobacteriota bacterium]|nr:MAG: ZIP family metal transporter [Acidobacteriota bacterium]
MLSQILIVLALGSVTALATGLGALPFIFISNVREQTVARLNAVAGGLMLGASFQLILEGSSYGPWQTIVGAAVGVAVILFGEQWLEARPPRSARLSRQMLLLVSVMTLHSFSEGIAVGVAFGGGEKLAGMITAAIAVHNIPEGLAISAVMRPKGASVLTCAAWSIFSSLPQPLMAVPAFLFVDTVRPLLPYGLGFAAGAMVFMVFFELMPEAYAKTSAESVGLLVSVTLASMILLQQFL